MRKFYIYLLLVILAVFGISSYFSILAIDKTSQPTFCAKCHTMKPMAKSFTISMHGGNNNLGFKAAHCTDCHLPHNTTFNFLLAKGISGTKDFLSELGLMGKANFKKSYFEYEKYVYDSGCLKCHGDMKNPEKAYGMDPDIRQIHEYYWQKKRAGVKISCAYCHNDYTTPNFAHTGLLQALK